MTDENSNHDLPADVCRQLAADTAAKVVVVAGAARAFEKQAPAAAGIVVPTVAPLETFRSRTRDLIRSRATGPGYRLVSPVVRLGAQVIPGRFPAALDRGRDDSSARELSPVLDEVFAEFRAVVTAESVRRGAADGVAPG